MGPAVGGILTQLLGWESIFVLQAPVALLALLALPGVQARPIPAPSGRPKVAANLALLLVSGALVAALFLLVILLINGWRLDPLTAGLVVTVMPLAGIAATRFAHRITPLWARAASGAILISGGLVALAWLPRAGVFWTIPPQLAIGAGLGLALSALTERALEGRSGQAVHGGWTIAARHAGVVLGLVLLTPIFTADLKKNEDAALTAGTAVVLDSNISALDKIGVARDVLVAVDEAKPEARIPDVKEVVDHRDDSDYAALGDELQEQLDRAVTNAFSNSFLVAALLGLLALIPILIGPQGRDRLMRAIAWSTAAVVVLVLVYVALGGASYAPAKVADPCAPRDWRDPQGAQEVLQQVVLSALDGAACELHVSREDMVLALANKDSREQFAREHGITSTELEDLVRKGLLRSIDDAVNADALDSRLAGLLRGAVERVPLDQLFDLVDQLGAF